MNRRNSSLRAGIALAVAAAAVAFTGPRADAIAYASAGYHYADFNNDGFGDMAVGAPGEGIGSVRDAGGVHVFYGTGGGVSGSNQFFSQATADVDGVPQAGDHFGQTLATGDFNGDGFDDLAIGIPGEKLGNTADTGLVYVLNGSAGGLTTFGARSLRQGTVGIGGASESGDQFGYALAAGNFDANSTNGRSIDDLAIGVPGEDFSNRTDAGVVQVLYGSAGAGLFGRNQTISQNSSGLEGEANGGDRFGFSLAAGNWNGDGTIDLAIGAPYETVHDRFQEGVVFSILSTAGEGVDTSRAQIMSQDTIFNTSEGHALEHFGYALASGDFDSKAPRRTFDDLAIGVPGDLPSNSGAVNIVYGTEHSFELIGQKWYQGKAGDDGGAILGSKESGDEFGAVLRTGDFDGNGAADLGIGVPGENVESATDVGGVHFIFSNGTDLDPAFGPNLFVTQGRGVPGSNESGDAIGATIGVTDFDGNGRTDVLVGCPGEDLGSTRDAGAALMFIQGRGWRFVTQDTGNVAGKPETGDHFGGSSG